MERVARIPLVSLPAIRQLASPAAAVWTLGFSLVLYLALQGGGYDGVVRGEVGVVVWWIVLLGIALGVLKLDRIGRIGWIVLGLMTAFTLWTAVALTWSESDERTVIELGRVAMYVGVLVLGLTAGRRETARALLGGIAAAIASVAGLAVLSRLHPEWFPTNETAQFLPGATSRLSYPLNYWNGLAALMALGAPLLLHAATSARALWRQALAAAMLPLVALCAYLTLSRGGVVATLVGVGVYLLLAPHRLPRSLTGAIAGAGAAMLVVAVTQRPQLQDGLSTSLARDQGNEMILMALVVCLGVALLQVAVGLAARHSRLPGWIKVPRGAAAVGGVVGVVGLLFIALAIGAPDALQDRWKEFKRPGIELSAGQDNPAARFGSASGTGRYQHWQAAMDAYKSDPLKGIGPGTYEFWWARNGSIRLFVRDAHSLYLEVLAETGLIGGLLLGAALLLILANGAVHSFRASRPEWKAMRAAATAACAAFCVAAAVDWAWELAVLPAAFFLIAGVALAPPRRKRPPTSTAGRDAGRRGGVAVLAVLGLVAVCLPLAGAAALRNSRDSFAGGQLGAALDEAATARRAQPYAASPQLQRALLLDSTQQLDAAAFAARAATDAEPTNWRVWLVLSRIEARRGGYDASVDAFRRARALNPKSPVFAR